MCDGILSEKLSFVRVLMRMEQPESPEEYVQDHMGWSLGELKVHLDRLLASSARQ